MNMNHKQEPTFKRRVVIIGAGASGLYCAHLLQDMFHEADCKLIEGSDNDNINDSILILEARDRIGGRIHSVLSERKSTKDDKTIEFYIDHGAAWVHGTGYDWPNANDGHDPLQAAVPQTNPMMDLLLQATGKELYSKHLRPVCRLGNPWVRPKHVLHDAKEIVLYVAGQHLNQEDPIIQKSLMRHFDILDQVSEIGSEMFDQGRGMETIWQSLQQTIFKVKQNHPFDDSEDLERIEAITNLYLYIMECWYGCPSSEMQLCEFTDDSDDETEFDETYAAEGDFYGPHCTLRNGMITVLEPLLRNGADKRVRCGEEVVQIQKTQDGKVMVETETGLRVEADCCVVTLPLGCLKDAIGDRNMFQPALSDEKQEAIGALRMGSYKKVFLTFDRVFWAADEAMIGMVRHVVPEAHSHELGNQLLFDNLWARDDIPCIEAVLVCKAAAWATGKPTDVIRDAVLDFMKDAMGIKGDIHNWCTDCHVTRWEEDRFSKGAYSSFKLGTMDRHSDAMCSAEWDGKLIFSGEATVAEFEGSVHAALFSGKKAADSVLQYLKTTNA